ncbi:TetR/AcrR family transcriptional regulator [Crossiella cryophila]|uniref:AcrR family transcriptional regulator n=1 Tax=Crossiella cryophila TaxID=43355 RepID=A0A7W7CFI6_9PSEU|nr:TetR family transcriptional regulator [Crossiella cryophila]MBB4680277.1 AcrR family transcriptional regulator [Crossiella cryophila]
MTTPGDFQRARRPEQVQARRAAILDAATTMLAERPLAEISLRELSDRVGLAKSNVLRYFDSREAIYLEILDSQWAAWLDELDQELPRAAQSATGRFGVETAVAGEIARSLIARPRLCELISGMAAVLERNITVEFARTFKRDATQHTLRLAAQVRATLPQLDDAAAMHFAASVFIITGGMWPYANPTAEVAQVMAEMRVPPAPEMFRAGLVQGLTNQLIGLSAQA